MASHHTDSVADYIIVGGGSTGCVLANRLSADPANRVILIEAGGDDRPLHNLRNFSANLNIYIPAGYFNLLKDARVNWNYMTQVDPGTGRPHSWPRGKVLGGCSSINGLMYVRGFPTDYDRWRQMGCTGWGWDDVLPYFRRAEDAERGGDEWQGSGGPQRVSNYPGRWEAIDAFIEACVEYGMPRPDHINGAIQEGVCYTQQITRDGKRASTAASYLHPVERRQNLTVITNAIATRILFEGKRSVGVQYEQGGKIRQVAAAREVIVSGGAVNSPQLLELSGIGDGERLRALGIDTIVHSPGVGENLRDHLNVAIQARLKDGVASVNGVARGLPLLGQVARYALTREGLLSGAAGVATGYMRSRPELDMPDLQLFATAGSVDMEATMKEGRTVLEKKPGFTVGSYTMDPQSRGSVHAITPDPRAHPAITPNYLSDVRDQIGMVAQVRALRQLLKQPSLAAIVLHELPPIAGVPDTDEALLEWSRQTSFTAYHPVGTCRMGGEDGSVVDPQLRVRGVEGLRVADASIMPTLVSANTNAGCIMIGEKLSDMLLKEAGRGSAVAA
ncbi:MULTISPECIES: GMC family oxidoreductase [unclassified Sphingobium]|uniref:GMC family oxidoreductase n=1 Tax=unclassified Sphingobium TaxID=2611147 RepID=UPI000D161C66|nr:MULTISPECIES: GMC family oxidoreductase N-terminal domain-containing protein [unclassified Sphingobium]MBG6120125.1 choline dehydrogenase [Sphingobium sp. JAI105]PSO12832.1 choline dehydrogenase [Sphingobium sp. AEW4]TWD05674.1 choline dehydrogenase [Sphingobium sp. AEW010]TWD23227.1 choline dehydrogenase [Sphingobium sp. AEW013]TWD25087.1 choline dehydrogenase [Sphingobium sp. AEW001]